MVLLQQIPSLQYKERTSPDSFNVFAAEGECAFKQKKKTSVFEAYGLGFPDVASGQWCSVNPSQSRDTEQNNATPSLNQHPSWPLWTSPIPSVHSALYLLVTYPACSFQLAPMGHSVCARPRAMCSAGEGDSERAVTSRRN